MYAKLWNIHQLCVLQVLIEKRDKTSRKEAKKNGNYNSLCRDIVLYVATQFQTGQKNYVVAISYMSQQSQG